MALHPDADQAGDTLLSADDGTTLAWLRLGEDDGEPVATLVRPVPGADLDRVAAQARADLAGRRLDTPDDALAAALVATGVPMRRAYTDMRHFLADLPQPGPLPDGWTLTAGGWDDDLATGLAEAYAPPHPDHSWTDGDTATVKGMFEQADPVPPLYGACARVVGPDGRSAGHVLVAGPVPWTEDGCGWILNLGVAPRAQGLGLGRALLAHALHGTRAADLPALGLEVTDGGPGRRIYDRIGFQVRARVNSLRLP
jgi:mycothiol synthase